MSARHSTLSSTAAARGLAPGLSHVLGYRDLLARLVLSDLRGRYTGSALGLFWSVIHPLVLVLLYILVFSRLVAPRLGVAGGTIYDFGRYLCAGLIPWLGFAEVLQRGTVAFQENLQLVRNAAFPRLLLPLRVLALAAINTGILMAVFLSVMACLGLAPSPLAAAAWMGLGMLQLVAASGLGLALSLLNVYLRDVAQMVSAWLQIWFWLTPIVYTPEVLPAGARPVLALNPAAWFSTAQQQLVLHGTWPSARALAALAAVVLAALSVAALAQRALGSRISDEL